MVEVQLVGESLFHAVSIGPAVQCLATLRRCLDGGQAFTCLWRWQ